MKIICNFIYIYYNLVVINLIGNGVLEFETKQDAFIIVFDCFNYFFVHFSYDNAFGG